jgi:CheY-like chemotaxis protein
MKKILLVEDDLTLLRMYQRILTIDGYGIETATDGVAGYEKARIFKPDLILLDVMMPKMNGLQTLEKLKQDPDTKKIPVFVLTNVSSDSEIQSAEQLGAEKYLNKSVYEPNEVIEIIRSFFYSLPTF